jgi:hypothetical protein
VRTDPGAEFPGQVAELLAFLGDGFPSGHPYASLVAAPVRLLLGHAGSGSLVWPGGGRQIDRRPARGCGSRLEGQAAPGVGAVSQWRRGGGGRPGGRRSA